MLKALTIADSEEYLRQKSKEVTFDEPELEQNLSDIKEFCLNNSCFAMAAVQLGIPKRICYIKSTNPEGATPNAEKEQIMMINPQIISKKGRTEYWEACVSGLNNIALVERPYEIIVKFQDAQGNEKQEKFEGFASTVISHELDHLDGIFHMDRAKQAYVMTKEERVAFREKNKYVVHSKTGDFEY